jgi:hypothetical protein
MALRSRQPLSLPLEKGERPIRSPLPALIFRRLLQFAAAERAVNRLQGFLTSSSF